LQFFTLNALLKKAFNEETRFAITRDELRSFIRNGEFKDTAIFDKSRVQFSMKDYNRENFNYAIEIEKGLNPLTDLKAVKLLIFSYFKPDKFESEVASVILLKTNPCGDCPKIFHNK